MLEINLEIVYDNVDPCLPSPCGPHSQCRAIGTQAACSCLPNHIGQPPNCRPECTRAQDCSSNKACINERCTDPCLESPCGINSYCTVVSHNAVCTCLEGYEGNPSVQCNLRPLTCKIWIFVYISTLFKISWFWDKKFLFLVLHIYLKYNLN